MLDRAVMLITGTRKGIGRYLAEYYTARDFEVVGCSREPSDFHAENYEHFCLDVANERAVQEMFSAIRKMYGRLDVLVNNAGVASMNHILLTPVSTVETVLRTNVVGTFLLSREAAKIMSKNKTGRIVNFATIVSLTQVLAYELADFGITVNAVGPVPVKTDLVRRVPQEKMDRLIARQAVKRWGEMRDITNVIDFFIRPDSDFVTGQVIYLGGIS